MKHGIVHQKVMRWVHRQLKCTDCGCKPWKMGEDFYVTDGLWLTTMPIGKRDDLICVGCFEKRLGRKLTRKDFKPWFRNNRWYGANKPLNDPLSERLADRLKIPI